MLGKVHMIRQRFPDIEIAWDGGINDQNARQIVEGGVDVLNVGGFIHKATDPQKAYAKLETVIASL
jgi:pentose-5-phosphate-3-epimerase